jgi:flagellar assembly protein FliH
MHWSKAVIKSNLDVSKVLEFEPPKLNLGVPASAVEFYEQKATLANNFKMNPAIKVHTGLDALEGSDLDSRVEGLVLERLKEVQEKAYEEAYSLGLEEGKTSGFKSQTLQIENQLKELAEFVASVKVAKKTVLEHNEKHMLDLVFHIASRIAMNEVKQNPEFIISILKNAVDLAASDEKIKVQISPVHIEFLSELKAKTNREFDFLKTIEFVESPDFSPGSCAIETNYGLVDSRIEERVKKMWETLSEVAPISKDKVNVA